VNINLGDVMKVVLIIDLFLSGNKIARSVSKGQFTRIAWLPSHLPEHPSVGIGTFSVFSNQWTASEELLNTDHFTLAGCRGIAGPFPPPLWIRVPIGAILICSGILPQVN
jgi:hypothetical protein